jgi:DNA-binding CsgD family transcriptional regulator
VFRAHGREISPASVDFGDPEWSEGFLTFGRRHPAVVDHRDADAEVYRRRRTIMRDDAIAEAHGMRTIARAANASAYLAAPIQVGGAVIGTLHADCYWSGRRIDPVDRDTLSVFADGFGYALERTWLLERTRAQSDRARQALAAADAAFAEIAEPGAGLDVDAQAASPAHAHPDALLTRREVEVVDLMARGARNAEIAGQLVISESTVKAHVGNILRKLQATNRSQAVARYLQPGRRS